jgi:hypothetical protein
VGLKEAMSDPDDTIPPPPESAPRRPRPVTLDELGAILIDAHAGSLARACAGWARRGYAIEDLVGVVFDCTCATRVFPRVELRLKYSEGARVRRALASAHPRPGRLTVAAHTRDGCVTYGAHLPRDLDAPDIEGPLQPLSAARRAWLDDYLDAHPRAMRRGIEKEVVSTGTHVEHTIVLVRSTLHSNWRACDLGYPEADENRCFVAAGRFEGVPGQVMILFVPEGSEGHSVAWMTPERLGFDGEAKARFMCGGRMGRYPEVRA